MTRRALATVAAAGVSIALALAVAPVRAQDEDPAAVAERVRTRGAYPSDVAVRVPTSEAEREGTGTAGGGRGPRGETTLGERETPDAPPQLDLPILRELMSWLGTLLASLSGPLGYVFLALALALFVLILGFFVASLRFRAPRLDASARDAPRGDDLVDPLLVGTGQSADALAAQGRWREAVHAVFLDALGRVGGAEGRHRSRTARELVRAIDARRAGREELAALLDLTELVWFGAREADETHFRQACALAEAVPRGDAIAIADEEASA